MAPKGKKIISTSGIFKKHVNFDYAKETSRKPRGISKPTSSRKYGKLPQLPLPQDFSDSIEQSRACILEKATDDLDSAHHSLTDLLATTTSDSFKRLEEATTAKQDLIRPLDEELLQFKDAAGKPNGFTTLGKRMEKFKSTVQSEEKEIKALWKEWTEVQQMIKDLGVQVLGLEGLKNLNAVAGGQQGPADEEQEKPDQVVEAQKLRLAAEIETMCKEAVEKMRASEKEMDIRSKKQQKEFLSLLDMDL